MTIKNVISDLISLSGGDTVTVLEVPPGTGKTKNSIEVSVELAGKGSNVVFFLPTHASALTAFAYAVNAFYNTLYKSSNNLKKLPFIIYYEGVERYCPLYMYKDLYYKAIEYARRRWWIRRDEYERLKSMTPEEIMRVFGWSMVCRKLCPVFKLDVSVGKARIFVPKSFSELANQVLTGEAKSYIKDAVNNLAEMSKKGLVKYLKVYMNFDKGVFSGICVRVLLNKAVVKGLRRKVQVFFKGSLIIAPTSGVEFLLKSVVKKLNTMSKSGAGISTPIVILDEYDVYFYRPVLMPLFVFRWITFERNLAKKIIETFKNDYANGVPFDIDEATAAVAALVILERLIEIARRFAEDKDVSMIYTPVALVFDAVAEEVIDQYDRMVLPLRPRMLSLSSPERFTNDVAKWVEDYVNNNGIIFINPDDIKRNNLWYYLQLWEWMLITYCKRHNIPFLVPALFTFNGVEFGTCYLERYDKYASAAKWVFLLRKKGVPHPNTDKVRYVVAYRATQIYGRIIVPEKDRDRRYVMNVWVVSLMSFDCKFYTIFGQDTKLFMTSATGLPWGSDFFKTRSGLVCPLDLFTTSLISYLEKYRYPKAVYKKDRTEYVMEPMVPDPIKKRIVIAGPDAHLIMKYSEFGRVLPEPLPHLPSRDASEADPASLNRDLMPYSFRLAELIGHTWMALVTMPQNMNYNTAMMVLCQRKEVAVRMALEAITVSKGYGLKPVLQVCTEIKCVNPPQFDGRDYIADMLNFMKELKASHILVRLRKPGVRNEVRVYVTWFRSKLCRGVDLPDSDLLLYTLVVGSPFRPPSSIDFVAWNDNPLDQMEVYSKSGRLETQFLLRNTVTGTTSKIYLCIANQPVDISESINELIQAYGRSLRKAWSARSKGVKYITQLVMPAWLQNKFFYYAQLWMKEIFMVDVRLTIAESVKRGLERRKMKQQQAQKQDQQQQTDVANAQNDKA
ncbi:MAG: hypothetical protein QXJ97_01380 [Desulfurococcaceae archaeon]